MAGNLPNEALELIDRGVTGVSNLSGVNAQNGIANTNSATLQWIIIVGVAIMGVLTLFRAYKDSKREERIIKQIENQATRRKKINVFKTVL